MKIIECYSHGVTVPPAPTNFTAAKIRRVHRTRAWQSIMLITAAQLGAVIRVFNEAGNVIETHKHAGDFKEPSASVATKPEFYPKLVRVILQNRVRIALR